MQTAQVKLMGINKSLLYYGVRALAWGKGLLG